MVVCAYEYSTVGEEEALKNNAYDVLMLTSTLLVQPLDSIQLLCSLLM